MASNHLIKFSIRLLEECQKSFTLAKRDLKIIASLAALIPFAYLVDIYIGESKFDTIHLRLIVFLFVASLWHLKSTESRHESKAALYFVFVAALALPFMFGTMLVLNAALTAAGDEMNQLWTLQYLVAMFIFIQVIHGKILSVVLWIASLFFSGLSVLSVNDPNYHQIHNTLLQSSACFLTAMVFGLITNRSADFIEEERLAAASAIGSYIAHEMRTPLATIRSLTRSAIRAADEVNDSLGLQLPPDGKIKKLSAILPNIIQEVEYSNTLIDMLLFNTKDRIIAEEGTINLSAAELITHALNRFPFSSAREKQSVAVDLTSDFRLVADKLLVTHVLFNLVKNAVFFMQRRSGGRAFITTRPGLRYNYIEITDTGPGISADSRARIFERFYTTLNAGQGAGIGLSFCKSVMESLGGQILCESKEGEYTTFRLLFPHPRSEKGAPRSG